MQKIFAKIYQNVISQSMKVRGKVEILLNLEYPV